MKKLGLTIVVLGMGFLSGCSGSAEAGLDQLSKMGTVAGPVIPLPVVTEADASLVGASSRINITDADCNGGECQLTVHFKNQGSKQARNIGFYFDITSSSVMDSSSSSEQESVEPEGDLAIDTYMDYQGTLASGKLGTLNVSYIKNENGDQGSVSVEVYKQ